MSIARRSAVLVAMLLLVPAGRAATPLSALDQYLWFVPQASSTLQQGVVRLVNREDRAVPVALLGLDAAGQLSPGSVGLTLGPLEARQLTSQDLEGGNAGKGLSGALGDGTGDWTLIVQTDGDIEALAYVRTPDGFLASVHERVIVECPFECRWFVPMFNPADNTRQASLLRIVNTVSMSAVVGIQARDDAGASGAANLELVVPPLATTVLTAADLESGNSAKGLLGALGNGTGKWNLFLFAEFPHVVVQNLLQSPGGELANLSGFTWSMRLPLLPAADGEALGIVRVVNWNLSAMPLTLEGFDDAGQRGMAQFEAIVPSFGARQVNARDLEGLLGNGTGDWRLIASSIQEMPLMALLRAPDGFLTSIQDAVPAARDGSYPVPMFNPARNATQRSVLRLANPEASAIDVTIAARDDAGVAAPGGAVTLRLAAFAAVELTAVDLEQGNAGKGLAGALGAGSGKWRLVVTATAPLHVMSLLRSPGGHVANLSTGTKGTFDVFDCDGC